MDKVELKQKLDLLGVNIEHYSLDGHLKYNSYVLYQSYGVWNVFHLSERGSRHEEREFNSESDACNYLYRRLKDQKELREKYN